METHVDRHSLMILISTLLKCSSHACEVWDTVIKNTLSKRNLESSLQLVYTIEPAKQRILSRPEDIDGCRLLSVNPCLPVNLSENSRQFLFSKLNQFCGSPDAFLNAGFGYVLVDGEEIVSLCFSGFVAGTVHAIDIETMPSARRKGYAEVVARAFLAEYLEKHLQPHWDCMADNPASSRLAEKLGFVQNHEYVLYSFWV